MKQLSISGSLLQLLSLYRKNIAIKAFEAPHDHSNSPLGPTLWPDHTTLVLHFLTTVTYFIKHDLAFTGGVVCTCGPPAPTVSSWGKSICMSAVRQHTARAYIGAYHAHCVLKHDPQAAPCFHQGCSNVAVTVLLEVQGKMRAWMHGRSSLKMLGLTCTHTSLFKHNRTQHSTAIVCKESSAQHCTVL